MDTNGMHGQKPPAHGQGPARGSLRRRVVFELEEDQLPLLEAAEARHGSKRAALLAALGAEADAEELRGRPKRAEAELARHERDAGAEKGKAEAKLKRALKAAEKKLAKAEDALVGTRKAGADGETALRREVEELARRSPSERRSWRSFARAASTGSAARAAGNGLVPRSGSGRSLRRAEATPTTLPAGITAGTARARAGWRSAPERSGLIP